MLDPELHERFVTRRAQGASFTRLAAELNVSRSTLVTWSRKFQYQIKNLRAIELESLRETLIATCEIRATALGQQLHQVEAELKKRDLTQLTTRQLISLT